MAGSRTLKLSILADVDDLKKKLDTGSKEVEGFGGKMEKFGKVAAAAFAAAAAAAAVYAVKLAVDGVKAAIEDEAAQARLANALKNVTAATDAQIAAVEQQILKTSLATGVADDSLRPALQRLATATGDVTEAQKLLDLALDISAATGKSVETVSNALGKAYEGNTGALGRLGIGLSNAEIKALGLDGTMTQLSKTFGGAATTQANTLQGQIQRLKILFLETQESVGQGLLPVVKNLVDYVTNNLIPILIEAKEKSIDKITKAFNDNKQEMDALIKFGKTYLIPFFEFTLVKKIELVAKVISNTLNVIGKVIRGIETIVNKAIDAINVFIRAYNAIPDWLKPGGGGDVKEISKVDWVKETGAVGNFQMSTGSNLNTGSSIPVITTTNSTGNTKTTGKPLSTGSTIKIPTPTLIEQVSEANWLKNLAPGNFDAAAARRGEEADRVVININGAIDPTSTARQIADLLNNEASVSGTFSGLGVSRFATRAE